MDRRVDLPQPLEEISPLHGKVYVLQRYDLSAFGLIGLPDMLHLQDRHAAASVRLWSLLSVYAAAVRWCLPSTPLTGGKCRAEHIL